jgi:hypothetical protein
LSGFRNAGWTTPIAAYETQLWARASGDMDEFSKVFGWTTRGEAKLDAFFRGVPDGGHRGDIEGWCVGYPRAKATRSVARTVTVRTNDEGKTATLSMQLGRAGWQFDIPEAAIDAIERRMRAEC